MKKLTIEEALEVVPFRIIIPYQEEIRKKDDIPFRTMQNGGGLVHELIRIIPNEYRKRIANTVAYLSELSDEERAEYLEYKPDYEFHEWLLLNSRNANE